MTPLAAVCGLVLYAGFALRGANSSITPYSESTTLNSSYYDSPSSANSVAFPNCSGTTSWIQDGGCDDANNNAECGYDGGDCCECGCISTISYPCGSLGYDCLDPLAGEPIVGCEVLPNELPAVSPCLTGTPQQWVVETTTDAAALADTVLCSGGSFEVKWKGHVSLNRTIYAIHGTVLNIVGSSDAVADGGGTTQLFSAFTGVLRVSSLQMINGYGIHGGAIDAIQQSEVTLTGVNVGSNTAGGFGGGVRLLNSYMALANSSSFTANRAVYGGAIYMSSGSTLVQHIASSEIYQFAGNSATDGGALYVSRASSVVPYIPENSTSTSSTHGSVSGSSLDQTASDFEYSAESHPAFGATPAKTYFFNNTAQSSGGAVYIDDWSTWVGVHETTFENNSAGNGGALFMGQCTTVRWYGVTLFARNSAHKDGGAFASAIEDPYLNISLYGAVSFLNNTCGGSGGALALFGDNMNLRWGDTAAEFSGNSAGSFGGAIFISEATKGHHFGHAQFTGNHAQNGGAVLAVACGTDQTTDTSDKTTFFPTSFYNCTFVGNSAVEAGGAIEIVVGSVKISNTDFFGNTASVGGALRIFGTAELLNSSFSDNKSGEGGGSAIYNVGIISEMIGLRFSANRFFCAPTEYVDFSEGNTRFGMICHGCDTRCVGCIVKDNTSVPTCATMFPHANSKSGTVTIEGVVVDRGYWRANNKSDNVLSCYNADACLGGLTGDPGYCSDGYEGPYCSVCREHYTANLAFTCSPCDGGNVAWIFVVLVIAGFAALAFVWHMVSIEKEDTSGAVVARVEKVLPLQSIKIVIVAWQIVTQFSSVAHVIYPETYQRLLDVLALVNLDMGWMLSAGCIMDVDFHDGLLMATVGPIVVMALLGMTYAVAIHRNGRSEVAIHAARRKHLCAVVVLTFLVYSSVSSAVFRTFACDELDGGNVYLRTDYRIECDSPRHKVFMIYAGIMVVVYPVGIPLFYTILLFRQRNMLGQGLDHEPPQYDSTTTLRKPYRASVFYYEVVECSRRILLTGVVVFIYPNTAPQIAVTTVIAFTFVLVSEGLRPYKSRWDAWVSRAGHVIVFLSMYVALLLKVDISNESQRDRNIFAGILVAAHGVMILLVMVETMAMFYSMRSQENSLPVSRSSRLTSF